MDAHNLIAVVKNEQIEEFNSGDTVRVNVRVVEGDRVRNQGFEGVVIRRRGNGRGETFTVRRIASGVGVEKVFPVHSPVIDKVEVDRESVTMRARMYYMRDRIGKAANQVKEKRLFENRK